MNHRRLFIALLIVVAIPVSAGAKMLFGPYLQSVATNEMLVCAYGETGDRMIVEYGDGQGEAMQVSAMPGIPMCARLPELQPDIVYHYRLQYNGVWTSNEQPFTFMADATGPLTFVVYGDTRSGDRSFDLKHREVAQAIRETVVPEFMIHTGDFVERGDELPLWINFFNIEREVLANVPLFPAIGMSDQPPELMRSLFPLLVDSPWYSFDRGAAHVAVLNLWEGRSQPANEADAEGEQAVWLRNDLAQAKARGARYLFVIMHDPPMDTNGKTTAAARKTFMPIFQTYQVNAVFSGAHYFSHALRDGVHYFTNGGGGAELDVQQPTEGVFRFFSPIHHFLVVEVGRAGARVQAVNSYGEMFYEADLEKTPGGLVDATAPTYVRSFEGGHRSLSLTSFFAPDCEDCEDLAGHLPVIAERVGVTLVVTFRSLEDADNEARLAAVTAEIGPTPIVVVGDTVLVGPEQVEAGLDAAIVQALQQNQAAKGTPWVGRLLLLGALLAGLLLLAVLIRFFIKRRR